MKKIKKIAASILAVAAMATSMVGMSASANQVVGSCGTFIWSAGSAKTVNNTNKTRIVTASVIVYEDGTGSYVNADYKNKTGGNGAYAKASLSTSDYPTSSYNFTCIGNIYNSDLSIAGVAESWTKYVD